MSNTTLLIVAVYCLTGIVIAKMHFEYKLGISLFSLFNAAWFLLFVFCPLNVIFFGSWSVRQTYAYEQWGYGNLTTAIYLLCFYIAFVLGYKPTTKNNILHSKPIANYNNAYLIIAIFSALGIGALLFHTVLIGGFFKAIVLAPLSRGNLIEIDNPYIFLRQFGYFLPAAFLLAFAIFLQKGKIFFVVAALGILTFYYGIITFGRREFFYPIFVAIALCLILEKPRYSIAAALFLCSALWILVYNKISTLNINTINAQEVNLTAFKAQFTLLQVLKLEYQKMIQGLCDSFIHFVAAQKAELWQFGFLKDIQELPLNFVPSKLLGFERGKGMYGETSHYILGKPLMHDVGGEEPLGLPGYMLTNFSIFGSAIIFYILGRSAKFIDYKIKPGSKLRDYAIGWLSYFLILIIFFEYLRDGVIALILIPRLSWILIIVYVYLAQNKINKHFCLKTL